MGGLFCMIVSDKIKVEKVMLIVPGSNLAEAFWTGASTQDLKNKMIEDFDMTLPKLKKLWEKISPDNYFKNKSLKTEFNLILSKNDVVIPFTQNGKNLVKILKDRKINHKVIFEDNSHKIEILKESVFLDRFKKWLSKIN